jgi:aqualysin 1
MANRVHTGVRRFVVARSSLSATLMLAAVSWGCRDAQSPTAVSGLTAGSRHSLSSAAPEAELIPGQYIITFVDSVKDVPGLAKRIAAQYGSEPLFTYEAAIKGFAAQLPEQAIEGLSHNPQVERIEQDAGIHLEGTGTQLSPVWGLDRIDQTNMPLDGKYSYGSDGAGVHVYIIDSGIRSTHADFGGRVYSAYTAISDGWGTEDCAGHGTGVAGSVGAKTYGVAKAVALYSVRVADCTGSGSYSALIAGIDWVTKNRQLPAVANVSLVGGKSSTVNSAVENSIAAGVVYAVAAGNYLDDACNYSPASAPHALTIAGSARDLTWTYDIQGNFTSFGPCVDLFAPGSAIRSTASVSDTATSVYTGTSIATPYVAGVAAQYLSVNPTATPAQVVAAIVGGATPNVITGVTSGTVNLLLNSNILGSVPVPPLPPDTTTPPPPPTTSTQPPVATFSANGCPKSTCTFDGSSSSAVNGIANFAWNFGDNSASVSGNSAAKILHAYTSKGSFTVTLTVTDNAGLKASVSHTVSIKR